jgi:hypothetical protein
VAVFWALPASPKLQLYDATLPSVSELWSVKEHTRSLHENVKFAVGAEFDGPFESPPQAASSTAPRATVMTGEKRIVLVSCPR